MNNYKIKNLMCRGGDFYERDTADDIFLSDLHDDEKQNFRRTNTVVLYTVCHR